MSKTGRKLRFFSELAASMRRSATPLGLRAEQVSTGVIFPMKFLIKYAALLCFAIPSALLSAQSATAAKPKTVPTTQTPATATVKPTTGSKTTSSADKEAPGGGAGKVWVNTDSNVYHCPGTRYYGKTKAGKYMTEAQAKAAGAKVAKGQNCSK